MIVPEEYRTTWSKKHPPYGAFDDYVVFKSIRAQYKFLIRPEEFDFIMEKAFNLWQEGKIGYIQILKGWNESSGYNDVDDIPTIIKDIDD